jgi:hypothetical protein
MTEWPLTPEELEKMIDDDFTIRPNVPYIKVSLPTNSSIGGTDGASG